MPKDYELKNETVEAEYATAARVRIFADDEGREVLMERSDFEALFEEA